MNMRQRRILNALALLVVAFLATALPALAASIDGGASIRSAPVTRGGDRVFDLSAGLQEGVTFTPLASGVTNDLVEDPFCAVDEELGSCVAPRLLLERMPLAPGESIGDPDRLPLYDHMSAHGPELLYVEAGEVVMATSSDQSFGQYTQEDAYAAGDQVALPMQEYVLPNGERSLSSGGGYELRNDSSEPACVLRLSLGEWQTYGGGFA